VREKFDQILKNLRASPWQDIAVDINHFQLEYPIQALILKDRPETRFVHFKTGNPSRKYESGVSNIKSIDIDNPAHSNKNDGHIEAVGNSESSTCLDFNWALYLLSRREPEKPFRIFYEA